MQISLSNSARNAMVDTISALIDDARESGAIELLSADGQMLAKLQLSKPCAPKGSAGTTKFYQIKEDPAAKATGMAVQARILDGDGAEVFSCDVSDFKGNAVIRLNSNRIVAGGPVRLNEFILTMPD